MKGLLVTTKPTALDTSDCKIFYETNELLCGYDTSCNSPLQIIDEQSYILYIEGAIYNLEEKEIKSFLSEILNRLDDNNLDKYIKHFVASADGEFIIYLARKRDNKGVIIVDKYARIPFYHSKEEGSYSFSRNLNRILELRNSLELNKQAIYEYITFEFFLGRKTFFEEIYRVEPYEYIFIPGNKKEGFELRELDKISYDPEKWTSHKKFLKTYHNLFVEAVKNRISYCNKHNFKLANTLSGGYDTRAVYGQLQKEKVEVVHYTFEYIQDESGIARTLMSELNDKNEYVKLSFDNKYLFSKSRDYLFKCQGLTNSYTAQVCTKDNLFLAKSLNNTVVWGGFGGEHIRHPYKVIYKNFFYTLKSNLLSFNVNRYCNILRDYSNHDFLNNLGQYFQNYPEHTETGKLKHFYNEYYLHRVGNGEDLWGRNFFWNIQPMMALNLMDLFTKMPLKYASFLTFRNFLCLINPRLINVPIFKEKHNLSSMFFFTKDLQRKAFSLKKIFNLIVKNNFSPFYLVLRAFKKKIKGNQSKYVHAHIKRKKIPYINEIANSSLIQDNFYITELLHQLKLENHSEKSRLFSSLLYFLEVEQRFKEKLKLNN